MKRTSVSLAHDDTRNIAGLADTGTPAAFCDAVRVETGEATFLYISGQTPVDDEGRLVGDTMLEQTRQVLRRLQRILEHEGATMADVVRVRVYVTDISLGQDYIKAYSEWFKDIRPVITMAEVKALARPDHLVEIEADAVIGSYLTSRLT